MGKPEKKCEDCNEGLPMWMATFSDMVTLLLTFFVLLLAMATFDDTQRVEAVFQSVHEALGVGGQNARLIGIQTQPSYSQDATIRDEVMRPIVSRLRQAMENHISEDLIRMVQNEQEVRLRLDDRVFFRPGATSLHPTAYALIADIADILSEQEGHIRVEGHTDATGDERANWVLASARALSVVEAFREKGPIAGSRLESSSHAHFQPASTFGEDATWNRRVEIIIVSDDVNTSRAAEEIMNSGGP
jgi:chemotaxis protein MotB